MIWRPPRSTLFPYTRSSDLIKRRERIRRRRVRRSPLLPQRLNLHMRRRFRTIGVKRRRIYAITAQVNHARTAGDAGAIATPAPQRRIVPIAPVPPAHPAHIELDSTIRHTIASHAPSEVIIRHPSPRKRRICRRLARPARVRRPPAQLAPAAVLTRRVKRTRPRRCGLITRRPTRPTRIKHRPRVCDAIAALTRRSVASARPARVHRG